MGVVAQGSRAELSLGARVCTITSATTTTTTTTATSTTTTTAAAATTTTTTTTATTTRLKGAFGLGDWASGWGSRARFQDPVQVPGVSEPYLDVHG